MRLKAIKEGHSVAVYIMCTTLSAAQSLNDKLGNGELKRILEEIFSMLLTGSHCEIKELELNVYSYNSCLHFFYKSMG